MIEALRTSRLIMAWSQPSSSTCFWRGLCEGLPAQSSPAGYPLNTAWKSFLALPVAVYRGCTPNHGEDHACTSRDPLRPKARSVHSRTGVNDLEDGRPG